MILLSALVLGVLVILLLVSVFALALAMAAGRPLPKVEVTFESEPSSELSPDRETATQPRPSSGA
jgi:hypothetical protein